MTLKTPQKPQQKVVKSEKKAVQPVAKPKEKAAKSEPKTKPNTAITPQPKQGSKINQDFLLASLMYMVKHYNKLFTAESLLSGLPIKKDRLTPGLFVRAAKRAGLKSKVKDRKLEDIPPQTLPVVALTVDNNAVIISKISENKTEPTDSSKTTKTITIVNPINGKEKTFGDLEEFTAIYSGSLIMVHPARLAELKADIFATGESWFWGTIKQFWKIYAQVGFASVLINLMAIVSSLYIMNVYDRVVPNAAFDTLTALTLGVFIAYVFDFIFKILRGYFIDVAGKGADILLASRLFQQVLNIRLGVHGASAGSFANQLRDFETLRDFFTSATLVTLIDVPFLFFFIAIIAMIGGPIALVPLLAVPLVLFISLAVQKPLRAIIEQATQDLDAKHGHLVETISGLETIKALNSQGRTQAKWEQYVGTVARIGMKSRFLASIGMNFAGFIQQMVTIGVVFYGVFLISDGDMSVGALVACTILAGRTMAPLGQAVALYTRFQQASISLKALNQIMQMEVERKEGQNFVHVAEVKGNIRFEGVGFTYPNSPLSSLKNVNFNIKSGEKIAIIGRTGSGKSTLLRLMLNLYNPTEGSVLLDDLEIRQLDPAEFRKHMGYVPQNLVLFSGTLRENILMGSPDATPEELNTVCDMAGINDFVKRHPMGLDMPVGERGGALSGGQRQTVAIARTLLKNPSVLLLDEPTSELDNRTEDQVLQAIKTVAEGKTLIVVTHKMSILELVDRIIIMDYGNVVADGPKKEVLAQLNSKKLKGNK